MGDFSTEQIIKVSAPKWSYVFRGVMIVACILAATTIPQTKTFGLILMVIFIVFTFLLFEYFNSEFEYSILDETLSIDRIMAKNHRKHCGTYDLTRATLVAEVDSQDALRMEHVQLKTMDYASGRTNEGVYVIYTYDADNNEQIRLFIEPDERILEKLKENCPCGVK
ncbi:MAG: hypothetical protein ACI4E1_00815 [Lachnospira sp.]